MKDNYGIVMRETRVKQFYASEVDPRKPAHTKGGYLSAIITPPPYDKRGLRMTIQTYPSWMQDSNDEKNMNPIQEAIEKAGVHPTILHNIR